MPDPWQRRLRLDPEAGPEYWSLITADVAGNRFDQFDEAAEGEPSRVTLQWTRPDGSSDVVVDLTGRPGSQVLGASFDGRYLAFSVYEDNAIFTSPWIGYVWDSHASQKPREFARSTDARYPDGTIGALPLMFPLMRDGIVYWVGFTPLDGGGTDRTLYSYDVVEGAKTALSRGKFNTPMFLRDSIITISLSDDRKRSAVAVVPLGSQAPTLPPELTNSHGIGEIAAGGTSVAWIADDQLLVDDVSDADAPIVLVDAGGWFGSERLTSLSAPQVSDQLVLFYATNSQGQTHEYVFDRSSSSYFTNEDLPGGSADVDLFPGSVALHHTDAQGDRLIGRAVLSPISELPPLPECP